MQRCPGLDALNPPPPIAPEPQRDPRLLQGMLGSIQIDASERFRYWDATGQFRRFHARPNLSRPRLVEQEFQLDLAHVTNLYQFFVNGGNKMTGSREVVARTPEIQTYFKRIWDLRCEEMAGETPSKDDYVFCHRDGTPIHSFKKGFMTLLAEAGVERDRERRSGGRSTRCGTPMPRSACTRESTTSSSPATWARP